MSIAVYISAAFPRHREVNAIAHELRRDGITIVSTWHVTPPPSGHLSHAQLCAAARIDRHDLDRANVLLSLGDPPNEYEGHGGKHWEAGWADCAGIQRVIVGHRESVFDYLDEVIFAPDVEAAKSYLRSLKLNSSGKVAA